MMKIHPIIYSLSLLLVISLIPVQKAYSEESKLQIIRFYKLNTKGQQNRLLIRESRLKKTGCQNFAAKPTIYRLTQIGFKHCLVFRKKNCEEGTEITGLWKGKDPDTKFKQGGEWLFSQDESKGEKAKSWHCE